MRRGCSVIPKSVTASRIISNFQVIELEDKDFNAIEQLTKTVQPKRLVDPSPFWGVDIYGSNKSKL
jgi:diketogulonate reductase-like aldo/keto reductase